MSDLSRGRFAAFFGPSITSVRSLAIYFPIGVLLIVVTNPVDGRAGLGDARWWTIALAAQAILTLVVVVAMHLPPSLHARIPQATWRAGAVVIAGAARGAVLAWLIEVLSPPQVQGVPLAMRILNSALISTLWLGFIGLLVQAGRDYDRDYRLLIDRAVTLARAELDESSEVDQGLARHWSGIQASMRTASERMRSSLGTDDTVPSAADLAAAASIVNDVVANEVRPVSHGLWFAQGEQPARIRVRALIWDALSDWRLPLRDIAVILCVIAFVGSILRAGLLIGVGFATLYVTLSVFLLWCSNMLARRIAGPWVGIGTVVLLPWLLLGLAIVIGQGVLHVEPDNGGAAVAAGATSIVAFGVLLLHRVSVERRTLLAALQARIDSSAIALIAREGMMRDSEKELGAFLHNTVQSELAALALQLEEASRSGSEAQRSIVREEVFERIQRIQESSPPWKSESGGPDRIREIITSWEGITSIEADLPAGDECTTEQWRLLTQAIEESVANAVRAGRADHIRIWIGREAGTVRLSIRDNGQALPAPAAARSGLGTAWLDHHAPGRWHRDRRDGVTHLDIEFA